VEIPVAEARVSLPLINDRPQSMLEFACSRCSRLVQEEIDERSMRLLMAAGVDLVAPVFVVAAAHGHFS
jgi:hypothetical protein